VKRRFRLTKSADILRVRRFGKSYAHPLVVLVALANKQDVSRFAVSAGRSIGNAVARNRAKRLLREGLRPFQSQIEPGWDIVLLARSPLSRSRLEDASTALSSLFARAKLIDRSTDE
jgi:ribonuclease P protein component